MKSFFILMALAIFPLSIASAQASDDIVVTAQFGAVTATVTPLSPGKASVEMSPVYRVSIDEPLVTTATSLKANDVSGHGTLYMARMGRKAMQENQVVCWTGVNVALPPDTCGTIEGAITTAILDVGTRRNEMLVLYPVVKDQPGGRQLMYAAHPDNTRDQLRCPRSERQNMASFFYVDAEGKVSIATPIQVRAYLEAYAQRC